jgi:DNA-directed RNA polymerase specialized sigma24 family protein
MFANRAAQINYIVQAAVRYYISKRPCSYAAIAKKTGLPVEEVKRIFDNAVLELRAAR